MKILLAVCGPEAGTTYELGASTTIGRDGDSDIQLIEEGISRRHACLTEFDDGHFVVQDLGSRNGTLVGGERVTQRRLAPGDRIEIGETTFEFREVADGSVSTNAMDMKLMTGPSLMSTIADGDGRALRAAALAAQAEMVAAAAPCCASPLSAQASEQGWAHCPACGASTS